jgi:hypothetical protein
MRQCSVVVATSRLHGDPATKYIAVKSGTSGANTNSFSKKARPSTKAARASRPVRVRPDLR